MVVTVSESVTPGYQVVGGEGVEGLTRGMADLGGMARIRVGRKD